LAIVGAKFIFVDFLEFKAFQAGKNYGGREESNTNKTENTNENKKTQIKKMNTQIKEIGSL